MSTTESTQDDPVPTMATEPEVVVAAVEEKKEKEIVVSSVSPLKPKTDFSEKEKTMPLVALPNTDGSLYKDDFLAYVDMGLDKDAIAALSLDERKKLKLKYDAVVKARQVAYGAHGLLFMEEHWFTKNYKQVTNVPQADLVNVCVSNGHKLASGQSFSNPSKNMLNRSANAAQLLAGKISGIAPQMIMCPNSGITVFINPVTARDNTDVTQAIIEKVSDIGFLYHGASFNASSSLLRKIVASLLKEKAIRVSLADDITSAPDFDLLKHLSIIDQMQLFAGLGASMYKDGVRYERACVSDVQNLLCPHIETGILDVSGMHYIRFDLMSQASIDHMIATTDIGTSAKRAEFTLERIEEYKNQLHAKELTTLDFNDTDGTPMYTVTLHIPSIYESIDVGEHWAMKASIGLVKMLGAVNDSDEARKEKRQNYIDFTLKQQFLAINATYIKSIRVYNGEDSAVFEDKVAILDMLNVISEDADMSKRIDDAIGKMLVLGALSVVGVPTYTCPSCGAKQLPDDGNMSEELGKLFVNTHGVLPIDPLKLFFTLQEHRVS